jgi:hypothetical protein
VKIEKIVMNGCCSKKQIVFKLDRPIQRDFLDFLIGNGFIEQTQYTAVGMIYLTNQTLIVSGPIGADRISVKCKKGDCEGEILNDFENLITQME